MSNFEKIQETLNAISPVPLDFPKLYLLGDTGAGKTTIIRKILGTEESKFPTTRQTRTTVAPTEYVIRQGNEYDITVILKSIIEVESYIDEILKDAIAKFKKDKNKERLLRNLKQTSDQRFRLYYLLSQSFIEKVALKIIELIPLVDKKVEEYQQTFPDDTDETDIFVELALSEVADNYNSICNYIIDEIQRKTSAICEGLMLDSDWNTYKYSTSDKPLFINKCKEILSSELNSISPLIEYARIRGNLKASWLNDVMEVVIIDGEGIGHDTKEASQLSSRHYDYFYRADSILLIEESKKPFVAGGKNALKSIVERGYRDKLLILFTKLDEVEPYDVDEPTNDDKIEEVTNGLNNVLSSLLKDDGVDINLTEDIVFYLGGLKDEGIDDNAKDQISKFLSYTKEMSKFKKSFIKPVYDFEMLSAFLIEPTKKFNDLYKSMLRNQHWKTVEAFNLRMNIGIDGFRMFTPITDFEAKINNEVKDFISNPISWDNEVSNKLKQESLDMLRREFNRLIIEFSRKEIISNPHDLWQKAYMYSGRGSSFKRIEDIEYILQNSVPLLLSSSNAKNFKDKIKHILEKAIENCEKT